METKELTTKERVSLFLAQPNQENFDFLRKDDLSFSLVLKSHSNILLPFINLVDEWGIVYLFSVGDDDLEKIIREQMSESLKSFDEWEIITNCIKSYNLKKQFNHYYDYKLYTRFEEFPIRKMIEFAKTFKQWEITHRLIQYSFSINGLSKNHAIQEMAKIAKTFDQWKIIYLKVRKDYKLKNLALEKMSKFVKPFDKWYEIYCSIDDHKSNKRLKSLLLEKMIFTASIYENWTSVYNSLSENHNLRNFVFEKMATFTKSFDECKTLNRDASSREHVIIAIQRMSKCSLSFNDWRDIYYTSPWSSMLAHLAFEKMSLCDEFHEWQILHDSLTWEKQEQSLHKISKFQKSFDEWKDIYDFAPLGSPLQRISLEKMSILL